MVESFGERVLRKMGWQQGKGLGSQGQGLARPIALETQNSTKGVSFDILAHVNLAYRLVMTLKCLNHGGINCTTRRRSE